MTNKKEQNDWENLLDQYLANIISRKDFEAFLQKAKATGMGMEESKSILESYWIKATETNSGVEMDKDAKFKILMEQLKETAPIIAMPAKNRRTIFYYIAAAVIALFIIGAGSYLFFIKDTKKEIAKVSVPEIKVTKDMLPGKNGAILTLSNGAQIVLDSSKNGTLAVQGNTNIIRKDGQILYDHQSIATDEVLYNTMTTPKGRQYELVLSDGSKIWLNAASSIRYPTVFTGKERKVEITGEVYFEIAHNAEKPFKVTANGMEVSVLGTHFNINSYGDEATIKTTLLEGSVKIIKNNNSCILVPGQQAQIANNASENVKIKVLTEVDLDAVLAWKNGYFSFGETDLATMMRQIGRWYDMEIVYAAKIPDRRFGGEISRNTNLLGVLKILEESKVYFKIDGNKIIVQP